MDGDCGHRPRNPIVIGVSVLVLRVPYWKFADRELFHAFEGVPSSCARSRAVRGGGPAEKTPCVAAVLLTPIVRIRPKTV